MDNIVQGMFGLSPYEIEQQQNAGLFKSADNYAAQAPFERAAGQLYRAGGMFGRVGAEAGGMVNPRVQEAQQAEAIMRQIDPSTAEGLTKGAMIANQMGNPKLSYLLATAAQKKRAEQQQIELAVQKQSLAERKQDFQEQDAMDLKRLQLMQSYELAKEKAEDRRRSDEERIAAMKEANSIRLQIAQMRTSGGLSGNIEKPMTEAQRFKVTQSMNKDKLLVGQVSQDADFLRNAVTRLKSHKGLKGMTGWKGYLPSAPESALTSGEAKAAETILEEIKGRTATLGRIMASAHGKLGNMAVQEWKIVADSLAALDPKSKEFTNQLDNLVAQVNGLEARTREAYEGLYENYDKAGEPVEKAEKPTKPFSANTKEDVKRLLRDGTIDRSTAKKILMDMDRQGKL